LRAAGSGSRLIAWDWGWSDAWAAEAIARLPVDTALMSVSEWDLPIRRGGVDTTVGEYSLSAVGPGPRAKRHWALARQRGLRTAAKIQAANSWELSAVPYIPAVENAAGHAANLRSERPDGLMLGWTLGGYPSPNLEVVAEVMGSAEVTAEEAMRIVARRRFGQQAAPRVVEAWRTFSAAFREFPFHVGAVYNAPLQLGPANLLWGEPSGYHATMVGFPYDDVDAWRSVYPVDVFATQLEKVADGAERALGQLNATVPPAHREHARNLAGERQVVEAAAIHFRSVANQARFVAGRRELAGAHDAAERKARCSTLETLVEREIDLARRVYPLQQRDSRLGFEASNQYYYVPLDLVEKVLNCRDLLDRWLPAQRRGTAPAGAGT
jgi:hypothetical protein